MAFSSLSPVQTPCARMLPELAEREREGVVISSSRMLPLEAEQSSAPFTPEPVMLPEEARHSSVSKDHCSMRIEPEEVFTEAFPAATPLR